MRRLSVFPLILLVSACSGGGGSTTKDAGGMMCDPAVYPCGPYGFSRDAIADGSTSGIYNFPGFRDVNGNGILVSGDGTLDDTETLISLSYYYQQKNYKVLFVGAAAGWCNPCRAEQPFLVRFFNDYKANGNKVAFLEAMAENNTPGQPADIDFLKGWTKQYSIPFDMMVDPSQKLAPYYDRSAFPMQMIITTADMKIVWQENGAPASELKAQLDAALAAAP